jgi:hypothetical protein
MRRSRADRGAAGLEPGFRATGAGPPGLPIGLYGATTRVLAYSDRGSMLFPYVMSAGTGLGRLRVASAA